MKLKKTGNYLQQIGQTGLSILHCNIRSLSKNLTLLNDILDTFNEFPTFIVISETKLNNNSYNNISLSGYRFVGTNTPTNAGGVGIYLKENIHFFKERTLKSPRKELKPVSLKSPGKKTKNLIGSLYRHPTHKLDIFQTKLKKTLRIYQQIGI